MNIYKKWLPDVLAIILFVLISFFYFFPADIEGRILYRHDASAGRGAGQETKEFMERTGEHSRWTNALFSGMPTYQMSPSYDSSKPLVAAQNIYHLWLPENVWYVFVYLLGFYILLRAFDFKWYLAVLGSVVWAFSSYFFIIIAAGHIWKVIALAYLPPLIAGIVLCYRGRYVLGGVLTILFTAFEVLANHVQMTYYYLFIIAAVILAFLIDAIRRKRILSFLKASIVVIIAALIGIVMNLPNLYHTWQYSQESMRGKSELVKGDSKNQTSSGLERDYITQWSYGIGETWTLLIPNAKGGASVPLADNNKAMEKADNNYIQIYRQIGQYWGDQPGTSGPVYVGAFVLMLFILSLFIVKGPMKWTLLAVTVLSILLSWGRNFMGFTNFFLDYMPMYAKFRTVASILVIAEFTIPLLAMMALKQIIDEPELLRKKIKSVYISFLLTAGFCFLFAIAPHLFFGDFISSNEKQQFAAIAAQNPQFPVANLMENLGKVRTSIFTSDCWRSFFIILIGTFLLLLYKAKKLKVTYMAGLILLLCLIDMWQVNKRYLNDNMFVEKSQREAPQVMTQTDELILQDRSLDYRVLNMATNTFNENETSYYHKSIGGYHAAKLRRYQELIETYIHPEMQNLSSAVAEANGDMTKVAGDSLFPVLNALNMKYVVLPLKNGQTVPLLNPYSYGNAWIVDKVDYADNANDELGRIGAINLRHEAVADKKFGEVLGESIPQDTMSRVTITSYEPNHLCYDVFTGKGGVVVFSEIYYPGWTATIDGEQTELGRVDYVLRAMKVKAGSHKVELSFKPASVEYTQTAAYVAYILLLLAVILAVVQTIRREKVSRGKMSTDSCAS